MTDLPEWVDGPKFVEWLGEVRPEYRSILNESQGQNLYRLNVEGTVGSLSIADRLCVALDLHIAEIPDDVWTDPPPKRTRRHSPGTRTKALELVASGATPNEAGNMLGLDGSTIRYWVRKARS